MRIGMMIGGGEPHELASQAQEMEARGFDSVWMANFVGYGLETLSAMTLIAHETDTIELGTAVIPIYFHHPIALAHQAISIQKIAKGRFTLGIGLSHPSIIEEWLGLSYADPVTRMRDYLSILRPLLEGESADYAGTYYHAHASVHVPDVDSVPLLVGAMGANMLSLAGEMADGTVPYLTGPGTLESHIIPRISTAAKTAGRPAPRIAASGLPIALVDNIANARAAIDEQFAAYRTLPSYRAMFDREGVAGAGDIAMVGDEAALTAAIDHLARIGVTDLVANPVAAGEDAIARTIDFLTERL